MEAMEERRIWQRVRGTEPPDQTEQVRRCLAAQGSLLSAYRNLARRGGRWRLLYEGKWEQTAALRGLLRVLTGQGAAMPRSGEVPPDLIGCFEKEQQLLQELTELSSTTPLGMVFAALAEKQRQRCCLVLELMGNM